MGQRVRSGLSILLVVVGISAGVAKAAEPAAGSNDDSAAVQPTGPAPAPEPDSALPFVVGIGAGYGFRPHPDGRNHGGTAHLYTDIPLGLGFGIRPEVIGFTYGASSDDASADNGRPLAHPMLASSLVYAFDDTDAVAVIGIGGFVGAPLELDLAAPTTLSSPGLSGGVLLSLGLRFRVLEGLRVEAGIRVPIALVEPPPPPGTEAEGSLRSEVALTGGLVLVPADLWRTYVDDG